MKKNVYVGLLMGGFIAAGAMLVTPTLKKDQAYQPREKQEVQTTNKGVNDYWNMLRANQHTGIVNPEDVQRAKRELSAYLKTHSKATYPFSWSFVGPDNFGGRTRGMLIDRNDNNVLYAGGVMGGIFKSTNKGASWYPIDDQLDDMSVSSICQTPDNTIYFGTGESFTGSGGQESFTPGFTGGGIYKSTDNGVSFTRIPATASYNYVNKVVAHPTKNIVFAGTDNGLYVSDENDDTKWTRIRTGSCRDIVMDKNGNMLAFIGSFIYRSTNPTSASDYTQVSGIPTGRRIALAYAHSDPNFAYAVVIGQVSINGPTGTVTAANGLIGAYQSKDNGQTFNQIIGSANSFFAPFSILGLMTGPTSVHSQGYYDLCVGVNPTNPEHIFIGGIEFAEWTPQLGARIVGSNFDAKWNPTGIHADKHAIEFDTKSTPPIMYITSDGGVARTTNAALNNYTSLYNNYGTTQFYGIAAGTNGLVVGGTQDNNTIVIDGNGNTPQAGVDVIPGDGFQCEVATINPDIIFVESQNGNLRRSLNAGGNASSIWDDRIKTDMANVTAEGVVRQPNNIFNTPLQLWEDLADSSSRLFFATDNSVWMANDAVLSPNPQWFKVASLSTPHQMQVTADGNSLFASGTSAGSLIRIDGLNKASWDTTEIAVDEISDSLSVFNYEFTLPASIRNRTITDIEVDQNDPNRVVITLGNYTNGSYIYVTENAYDADPTWRSLQGGLPSFPVYDAEISVDDPNTMIIGTEFGIFYAQNSKSSVPTWVSNQDSLPRVPVLQMRQVEERVWKDGSRTGAVLYAGTHGRGIWKSSSLLTSAKTVVKENVMVKVYPNPTTSSLKINFAARNNESVKLTVMDYQGRIVLEKRMNVYTGENTASLNVASLTRGNYIISIKGSTTSVASKFVKID